MPDALRVKVIEECHSDGLRGHHGVMKTVWAIRQRYHFPRVRRAVSAYIDQCDQCIRAKAHEKPSLVPLHSLVSVTPFRAIAADLYSPGEALPSGHRYVLTIVDHASRWVQFHPLRTKLPAEVISTLCRCWLHYHGVPQFILTDRGSEFLGLFSTIAKILGMKHIRTTPYHPQSNGLCEVQHKTLTRELRIRSQRDGAPTWTDLLTEVQFAMNVCRADEPPYLSPFELVFGRAPRMSPSDVAFPTRVRKHTPTDAGLKKYHDRLVRGLQGMRFCAAENAIERKERQRAKHDVNRTAPNARVAKRGDLVFVSAPTRSMKKLRYQWSAAVHLVTKVREPTCEIKSLVSPAGKEGKKAPATTANLAKVISKGKPPPGFWLGARVRRRFSSGWFLGTVADVFEDDGHTLFQIAYDDCDSEDYDYGELVDRVCYHPGLDGGRDLFADTLPEVGSMILFSWDQAPRLGQVKEVHPGQRKPVTVQLWKPHRAAQSLDAAKYMPSLHGESPELVSLTVQQVRLDGLRVAPTGYLTPGSRVKVRSLLRSWAPRGTAGH